MTAAARRGRPAPRGGPCRSGSTRRSSRTPPRTGRTAGCGSPSVPAWPASDPGQFVMLSPGSLPAAPRFDPLLPRPMAIFRAGGGALDVLYKVTGRGTALLAAARPGERIRVVGPLGCGFPAARGGRARGAGRRRHRASLRSTTSPRARASAAPVTALLGAQTAGGADGGRRLPRARRGARHRDRGRKPRPPRPRDRAPRARARRPRARLRVRADADDARRRRARRSAPGVPAWCRSRTAWPAGSASASAARCRAGAAAASGSSAARGRSSRPTGSRSRRSRERGVRPRGPPVNAPDLSVTFAGVPLRNPVLVRVGHLRLRARARAVLRPAPARRLRREEPHARAAPREPAAAHRRGRGGHAELDQPRERGRRGIRARQAAAHPRGRAGLRERLRHRDRPLRRGLQAAHRRSEGRGARDQRVVPAREGGRHRVRPGPARCWPRSSAPRAARRRCRSS